LCSEVEWMYNMITSIEFWMSLVIKQLIIELLKFKPMNILKNIIVGVGAVVWDHNIMTCRILCGETAYQDGSDGGSILPSHSLLKTNKKTKWNQKRYLRQKQGFAIFFLTKLF
jgi:hypothetical protein